MSECTICNTRSHSKHSLIYGLAVPTSSTVNAPYKSVHDSYIILRKIGGGKFSSVYQASHRLTSDLVALKRLKPKEMKKQLPGTWKREIEILSKLNHPNVTKLIDTTMSEETKSIYLILEYAKYSFREVFDAAKFTDEQIRFVMNQLLLAVKYLHDNNIIHRDLKQENLLFSEDGMLKVTDFGLSIETSSPIIRRIRGNDFGTQYYKGIEILLGSRTYTNAIDIWAVGCIFAELLKGGYLFSPGKDRTLAKRIFKVCGTPTETDWPGVSELPGMKAFKLSKRHGSKLRDYINRSISDIDFHLLKQLLSYNPDSRISAKEALQHAYFKWPVNDYDSYKMAQWLSKLKLRKFKACGL